MFYCPIEKKSFLQAEFLKNGLAMEFPEIEHCGVFYDEYYITSTLNMTQVQPLYSYLVGCNEAHKNDRKIKIFQYKNIGPLKRCKDLSNIK